MKTKDRMHWPWWLTAGLIVVAALVFFGMPDMLTRSQVGDYLSGFASAIAFVWLIAAHLQQARDLRLQRKELSLQRESLDLQREELKKLGKYSGLEQVAHMLQQFDQSLLIDPDAPVKSTKQLLKALVNGIPLWKTLLESDDPNEVFDAYAKWMAIYAPSAEFVARVISAVDLYCEASGQALVHPGADSASRVYFGYDRIKNIPHISNYIGSAYSIAAFLVNTAPGLNRIQLAGLEATEKLHPGTVKAEGLQELRAKVKAHSDALKAASVGKEST